jgi:hypothetical protein
MLCTLLTTRPNPEAPPLLDIFYGRRQADLNLRDDCDARAVRNFGMRMIKISFMMIDVSRAAPCGWIVHALTV